MGIEEKISSNFVEIGVVIRDKDGNIKNEETIQVSLADMLRQVLQSFINEERGEK